MPSTATRLASVARPKQARSRETLRRILDAAEALIEEKGLPDASIPEIVRRADSSVGGFYARFKDKKELLRALEERFYREMIEKLEHLVEPSQWAGAPIARIVEACVAELVDTVRERQALLRAFMANAAHDPEFIEHGLALRRRIAGRFGDLLLARAEGIGHPEPAMAVDLGVQFAFGFMLQNVIFGSTSAAGRTLSDAELQREISRVFLSYVSYDATVDAPPNERNSS